MKYLHMVLMARCVQFIFANDWTNDIIQMQTIRFQSDIRRK